MTVFVFTGPTLSATDAAHELDATYLPPVSQGDVYRAALERPPAIGIVDGYFERVPAVWHKEILWAMTRGIHVFGASSMGALRAAELSAFGMHGVGRVFDAFASGVLEDDDEVAVVHGPAESGYIIGSEAMVNIRATLEAAIDVITEETRDTLMRIAKALHYADRSYETIVARAEREGLPAGELHALRDWLPAGRIDQKRLDAIEMLQVMREHLSSEPEPLTPRFTFQHTDAWEQLRRHARERPLADTTGDDTHLPGAVREEAALLGDEFTSVQTAAQIRALSLEVAAQMACRADDEHGEHRLRDRIGPDGEDLGAWTAAHGLTPATLRRLIRDESRIAQVDALLEMEAKRIVPDVLRLSGTYNDLAERARRKQLVLARRGLENPSLADASVGESELWAWYFGTQLNRAVPVDVDAYAHDLGFSDPAAFRIAVLREYLFLHTDGVDAASASSGAKAARSD